MTNVTALLPVPAHGTDPTTIAPTALDRAWLRRRSATLDPRRQPAVPVTARVSALIGTGQPLPALNGRRLLARPRARRPEASTGRPDQRVGARSVSAEHTLAPHRHVRTAELLARLSVGLDAATGRHEGHAVRTAYLSLRLAATLDLSERSRQDLLYAALLKDLGAPAEASMLAELVGDEQTMAAPGLPERHSLLALARYLFERTRHLARAERGLRLLRFLVAHRGWARRLAEARYRRAAELVDRLGLPHGTRRAVEASGERWDGHGGPDRLAGESIPLLARIVSVAAAADELVMRVGPKPAERLLRLRRGHSLDPELTSLALDLGRLGLWQELTMSDQLERLLELEPPRLVRFSEDGLVAWVERVTRRVGSPHPRPAPQVIQALRERSAADTRAATAGH
jgi:hypothetical protein